MMLIVLTCLSIFFLQQDHCVGLRFRQVFGVRRLVGKLENGRSEEPYPSIDLVRHVPHNFGDYHNENDIGEDENESHNDEDAVICPLLAPRIKQTIFTASDLRQLWGKHCIESNQTALSQNYTLLNILPLLYRRDAEVILDFNPGEIPPSTANSPTIEDFGDAEIDDNIYISETELNRKWFQRSLEPMGKSLEEFTVEEALQLVEDEGEDEALLTAGLQQIPTTNKTPQGALDVAVNNSRGHVGVDSLLGATSLGDGPADDSPAMVDDGAGAAEYVVSVEVSLGCSGGNRYLLLFCFFLAL